LYSRNREGVETTAAAAELASFFAWPLYSRNHEGVETTVAAAALPFLAVHGGGGRVSFFGSRRL